MTTSLQGWRIIDIRQHNKTTVVYLRIPSELSTLIDGGCQCTYCKVHPTEPARWDTMAVCAAFGELTWTVHFPDPPTRFEVNNP